MYQVDEEPDPISLGVCGVGQPPQGLKRKVETPLGSPPEPGQILQQQEDDGRPGRYKIRVKECTLVKDYFKGCQTIDFCLKIAIKL